MGTSIDSLLTNIDDRSQAVPGVDVKEATAPRIESVTPIDELIRRASGGAQSVTLDTQSTVPKSSMTREERIREVTEFGGDPAAFGFDAQQDDDGRIRALREIETGNLAAFRDFKTGEFRSEGPTENELLTEFMMRSIPGSETSGLESTARSLNRATPGEIARFGLEVAMSNAAGNAVRSAKGLKHAPKAVRALGPVLAEGLGAGAGSLASEAFDPTGSTEAALGRAGTVALFDAAGAGIADTIGHFVLKGGFKTAPDAGEAFDELKKRGTMVTAGRLSSNRLVDIAEVGTEASFGGGGSIVGKNEEAQAVMQHAIDNYVDKFVGDLAQSDVDNLIVDALTDRGDAWKATGTSLYENVDKLIDDKQWVEVTKSMLEANEIVRVGGASGLKPEVERVANALLRQLPNEPESVARFGARDYAGNAVRRGDRIFMPWWLANELRSTYAGVGRTGDELVSGAGAGAAKRLVGTLDDEMEVAATALDGDALDAWRAANAFWKDGHEVFNSRFVKSLLHSNPDDVFRIAMRRKKPQQIKHLRRVIVGAENPAEAVKELKKARRAAKQSSNPDAVKAAQLKIDNIARGLDDWQALQGAFIKDLLEDTTIRSDILNPLRLSTKSLSEETARSATGRLLPRRSAAAIEQKLERFGAEAFEEVITNPGQRKTFRKLLRVLDATQRPAGKNIPGRIAVQLNQAGAVIAILAAPAAPAAAGGAAVLVFGVPAVAARVLTNDTFVEWVVKGSRLVDPAAKMRAFNRAAAIAIAHGATYKGDDPELLKQQAERDENFGPGSSRIGSKTPTPRKNRTALP